jgi:hypothetical protein
MFFDRIDGTVVGVIFLNSTADRTVIYGRLEVVMYSQCDGQLC